MMRLALIPLALIIVLAPAAETQERSFPYTIHQSDLLLLPGSFLFYRWCDSDVEKSRTPLTLEQIRNLKRSDVNRFDRSATGNWSTEWADLSDTYRDRVLVMTIGIGLYEVVRRRNLTEAATLGIMFLETAFLVGGTTYLVKNLAGRKRPFVYNTTLSADWRFGEALSDGSDVFHSFVSGHATSAFALATFTSTVFRDLHGPSTWSKILWGSTLTFATLTAYARVKAGKHYPSDVIAGAFVGGAIGYLVPVLHRNNSLHRLTLGMQPDRICLRLSF